jgi:hypothetical protein
VTRPWFALASLCALFGCGTDAEGVSGCRALENARCQAAASCGYPNVDECRRYQRDQCLHGVALETATSVELDACVADIERAGRCAAEQGATTAASSCAEPIATDTGTRTACDVVVRPEQATSCAFFVDAPTGETPAAPEGDGGT